MRLKGEIDEPGDVYERHADAVADAVVAGASAEALLDHGRGGAGGGRGAAIQRDGGGTGATAGGAAPVIAPPTPGINKAG